MIQFYFYFCDMSKLPNSSTSIFSVMSQLAKEHNAINLAQGFPNFPVENRLLKTVNELLYHDVHQYSHSAGSPNLLQAIENLTLKKYGRKVNRETEIVVTAGATQGIYTAIQALIHYHDEVIVLDPCYDSYEPSIIMAGGKPVHVDLNSDYLPDFNAIEKAITSKTKMLIINNPHNPSGRIWTEKDFEALETILEKHPQIILLSDEVYEYISFSQPHISCNSREKLVHKTIVVSSFGKSLHITGWKIGYLIAPPTILNEIKKVHQFVVFSVNSLAQETVGAYLNETDFDEVKNMYQRKKENFRNILENTNFKLLPCDGTYFQVVDYSEISNQNDVDFAKELTIQHGVAAIPISVFYQNKTDLKRLRFCFAKTEQTLVMAGERLKKI